MSEGTTAKKNRCSWLIVVLFFVIGVLLTLIGGRIYDNRKIYGQSPSDSPYESFTNFLNSFQYGIDSLIYDYCLATKDERELISISLVTDRVSADFRQSLIEAYGNDAWDILNDPDNGPSEGNISIPLIREAFIDKDKIKYADDCVSYCLNDYLTLKSLKTSKGWLIDASCLLPEGANIRDYKEFCRRMPILIKKYQKVIGYPGVGVVDIDAELGREFLSPLFSNDMPHRFDVDAIIAEIDSGDIKQENRTLNEERVDTAGVSETMAEEGVVRIVNAEVGGVRLVKFENQENGIRPFNWDKGYTLSLVVKLSNEVLGVDSGYINKAVTDTGANIVKDPRISFPRLSNDKKHICFDVTLLVPNDDVLGFEQISGELDCSTSTGEKIVDLGIKEFEVGARGSMYNSKILSIKEATDEWSKGEVELQLTMDHCEYFGDVSFFDNKGNEFDVDSRGWSSDGQIITLVFLRKGGFPENGRIEIIEYQGVENQKKPFKMSDISLLGSSL